MPQSAILKIFRFTLRFFSRSLENLAEGFPVSDISLGQRMSINEIKSMKVIISEIFRSSNVAGVFQDEDSS